MTSIPTFTLIENFRVILIFEHFTGLMPGMQAGTQQDSQQFMNSLIVALEDDLGNLKPAVGVYNWRSKFEVWTKVTAFMNNGV